MKKQQSIEEKIQETFISNGWTLSLAESCTGGALAATLTRVPGCSNYFLGSVVVYSNKLKTSILGVDESVLKLQGAVSEGVVKQMADGARSLTGSDYSIAVSGIAGPSGGSAEKPVGTVWCAISQKNSKTQAWLQQHSGNREEIINKSVNAILEKLWQLVSIESKK